MGWNILALWNKENIKFKSKKSTKNRLDQEKNTLVIHKNERLGSWKKSKEQ